MSPGLSVAHYRITAKLGEGGMGEVWRATDTKLDREVAIKILPEALAADPDRMARFEREAKVLASLNHPNIAAIYGVEERALVMELVEGPTLAERIAQGAIPVEEALPTARQIAEALEYAHEKGIIHRDLKPANIKITPEGRVKVLDFGLAKAMASEPSAGDPASSPTLTMRATMAGALMGTAAYMSPEQARGQSVDRRADIWAFGVVLHEMLTGRQLFVGPTISDTLAAVLKTEPDVKAVPAAVQPVVKRCLRKDPRQRWQAIGDVRIALEEGVTAAPERDGAPRRPALVPWVAAALAIGTLGGWAVARRPRAPADDRVIRFQIDPPLNGQFAFGNGVGGIALSPDGRSLAFVAAAGGKTMLWVRPLGDIAARPIAGTEGAINPLWSPDGRSIGYFMRNGVWRVDMAGGTPLRIGDALGTFARGGVWTSDGRILFGSFESGLFQVPASGGSPSKVTKAEARGDTYHRWPQLLPGGGFLYQARNEKPGASGIFAASWAKPEEAVRVLDIESAALYAEGGGQGYLLWLRGATLVAQAFDPAAVKFSGELHPVADPVAGGIISLGQMAATVAGGVLAYSASSPSSQFTWMDRTGNRLATLGEPGEYAMSRLSPDGHRVAALRYGLGGFNLWMLEVARGVGSLFPTSARGVAYPVWSPLLFPRAATI
jgi:predicted Ser/Thr protein kinase